jgi:glycosyltransferase involved in cell wall biosynthesis
MKICYCRDMVLHATTVLRYVLPAHFLEEHGAKVSMAGKAEFSREGKILTPEIKEADIIVMGQVVYPDDVNIAKLLKKNGKKIAYDCDDLYFDNKVKNFNEETLEACREILHLADLVTVCSPYLGKMCEKYGKIKADKIKYIPNFTVTADWDYWWKATKRADSKKIKIGMMGASNHAEDWLDMLPILQRIKKKYGNKVSIEIMGMPKDPVGFVLHKNNKDLSQELLNAIVLSYNGYKELGAKFIKVANGLEEFYPAMCRLGWDIGLAPLQNTRTDKSKSYLKYLDYGMAHIAGIYQGISPFTDVIDERNGLYARTKEDWFEKICLLVESEPLRQAIVGNALKDIKENHNIQKTGWKEWHEAYSSIL